MSTLLIADDHPLFREALRGVVARLLPQAKISEAENAELAAQPPVTGAQYAQGVRPVRDGTLIVEHAEEACPVPAARQGSTSPA